MLLPLPSTCYNMFSIEMINPNYMTHLDHVDRIIITWKGRLKSIFLISSSEYPHRAVLQHRAHCLGNNLV